MHGNTCHMVTQCTTVIVYPTLDPSVYTAITAFHVCMWVLPNGVCSSPPCHHCSIPLCHIVLRPHTTCKPPLCFCRAFIQSCRHKCWPFGNSHTQSICSSQPSISLVVHCFAFVLIIIKASIKDDCWMMECAHETIYVFLLSHRKQQPLRRRVG